MSVGVADDWLIAIGGRGAILVGGEGKDWKSGDKLWVVEVIAPFGAAEELVKDLKTHVFPNEKIKFVAMSTSGKEVREI